MFPLTSSQALKWTTISQPERQDGLFISATYGIILWCFLEPMHAKPRIRYIKQQGCSLTRARGKSLSVGYLTRLSAHPNLELKARAPRKRSFGPSRTCWPLHFVTHRYPPGVCRGRSIPTLHNPHGILRGSGGVGNCNSSLKVQALKADTAICSV